jgi:hypothetical protein
MLLHNTVTLPSTYTDTVLRITLQFSVPQWKSLLIFWVTGLPTSDFKAANPSKLETHYLDLRKNETGNLKSNNGYLHNQCRSSSATTVRFRSSGWTGHMARRK